jgi:hypoxanthine-DNA glycosylase
MPGVKSLAAVQYYAHPQNAFWRIMGELIGFDHRDDYMTRVAALQAAGIAVWDVLQSCQREGSLDARIETASQVTNDFNALFQAHPQLMTVCFNGAKAESVFRKVVLPGLAPSDRHYIRLPSTSPAHAALPYAQKRALWRLALGLDKGFDGAAEVERLT